LIYHNPQELFNFKDCRVFWMMNINQELSWNDVRYFPTIEDRTQLALVLQQEQQLLMLAKPHDIVLLRHEPDAQFLEYLQEKGLILPEIIVREHHESDVFLNTENVLLVPYIQSEETERLKEQVEGLRIYGDSFQLSKKLNNKYFTRKLMQSWDVQTTSGYFCKNITELKDAYNLLKSNGFKKCVLKIPYGSSGKGLHIIDSDKVFHNISRFIARRTDSFELLIEGWHSIERSINSQLLLQDNTVHFLAITEQLIDDKGIYLGTNFTPVYSEVSLDKYYDQINKIGRLLMELGYKGIIGIDSVIDKQGVIYPVIEFNARFTQVTYLLPIVSKLAESYEFIESSFYDFESTEELKFIRIEQLIENTVKPYEDRDIFVYTFAKGVEAGKYRYRMFLLFVANTSVDVRILKGKFEGELKRLLDFL
jgi:hypothetical protein